MLKGYQYDYEKNTSFSDSSINANMTKDKSFILLNRGNELNVTTEGLSCIVDTGQVMIQGRLSEVLSPESVSIPTNTNGFLVVSIDLSQENSATGIPGTTDYTVTNNQQKLAFVSQLLDDNLQNGGVHYTFNLGSISSDNSTVTFTKNPNLLYSPDSYISEELLTGDLWIDGSQIYRKTIVLGKLLNKGTKAILHNINNLSKVIKFEGIAWDLVNNSYYPLPYSHPTVVEASMAILSYSDHIEVITGNDRSNFDAYATLWYTKDE